MAKEQKRGNREKKKPKQVKVASGAPASGLLKGVSPSPGMQKRKG